MRTYRLFQTSTDTIKGVFSCVPPRSEDFFSDDWRSMRLHLDRMRPGAAWTKAIFDLQDSSRIWLVDASGRMSHYLQSRSEKADGRCPKCSRDGVFVRMALVCPVHGAFAGL